MVPHLSINQSCDGVWAAVAWGCGRFLDFVDAFIDNLVKMEEAELSECASKAYEVTLADRHSFIIRNTIYVRPSNCKNLQRIPLD